MPNPIASRTDDLSCSWPAPPEDDPVPPDPASVPQSTSSGETSCPDADPAGSPPIAPGVLQFGADAHANGNDIYIGAFALKGHDPKGADIEVFSASGHADKEEVAAQVAMARTGVSLFGDHIVVRGEALTAQMRAGTENADGSVGLGASIGHTIAGGEITASYGGSSLTLGASVGTTFGYAAGVRDSDHDGQQEYCGRVDFGAGTLGACIEKMW